MAAPVIKAVIFDCFGVLYTDSKQSLLEIVSSDKKTELQDLFTSNNYGYFDKRTYLRRVAEITGLPTDAVADYIAQEHQLNIALTSFISEQLKPQYKIGLLSNIGREWIEDFFSKHQLHQLFDGVVLSGEEGIAKPHPAIFELMASRLGLGTGECLMIDDIEENCEGAQIAGMEAIHYTSNDTLLVALSARKILKKTY